MPRIKPARTPEEAAAVPKDKPLTVEFKPEGVVDLETENPFEENDAESRIQRLIPPKLPATKEVKKSDPPQEDDADDLRRQLEDMRRAKEEADLRVKREIEARQEAERLVEERRREAAKSLVRAEDAEYEAILNAINAAEREAEKAQQDIELASAAGDHRAVADANRRMARAESRMAQLEDGKEAIERQKTEQAARAKEEAARPPAREERRPQQQSVDDYIDQLPNLLPSQRDWLRAHPETMSNQRMNLRLQGAHVEAEDNGLRPGTKKYFEYLEERLGFTEPPEEEEEVIQRAPVAAPPSRVATSPTTGKQANTRITLTPEQREMAAMSGVDEITYAKQLQRLDKMKREGLIN